MCKVMVHFDASFDPEQTFLKIFLPEIVKN